MTPRAARCNSAIASTPITTETSVSGAAGVMPAELLRDGRITRQLAEIAFMGAFLGQTQAAETIFRSLRILCPGNTHIELGLAMVYSLAGRPDDGLAVLGKGPALEAGDGLASVCASLMLRETGHHAAADKKLTEALAQGGIAAEFARKLSRSSPGRVPVERGGAAIV